MMETGKVLAEFVTAPPGGYAATHFDIEVENLQTIYVEGLPDLAPELIHGILRQGHKMLIAGPSKAYKSFALLELAVAIAEGRPWMGFNCRQGRVLYVNLEIDRASFLKRIDRIYEEVAPTKQSISNIDLIHLRGKSKPLGELAPKLIEKATAQNYGAIILDPIYKLMKGDENAAGDIGAFCNQLDNIARETGAAVVYCHHFSKGAQGAKKSIDRASGSGVFGRDPDAVVTFSELERTAEANTWLSRNYESIDPSWRAPDVNDADFDRDRQALIDCVSAWRMEFTLREFSTPAPVNVWARYPIHVVDRKGVLSGAAIVGGQTAQDRQKEKFDAATCDLEKAFFEMSGGGPVAVRELEKVLGVSYQTVKRRVENSDLLELHKDSENHNAPQYVREVS